jgi:hypothetical protein
MWFKKALIFQPTERPTGISSSSPSVMAFLAFTLPYKVSRF